MNKEFFDALDEIAEEKGIPSEVVENAIESALLTAYKKSYGSDQNVRVEMDRCGGGITFPPRPAYARSADPSGNARRTGG